MRTLKAHELTDWIEPDHTSFMGYYHGGSTIRVTNGKRTFILHLENEPPTMLYNFSAHYRDGQWVSTTKKAPGCKIVKAEEVIEARITVYPLDEELDLTFVADWDD